MSQDTKFKSLWSLSKGNNSPSTKPRANDLVMAWAVDKDNGQPRYIFELDEHHKGAKCNCLCASCKLPLTAVNVKKEEYQQRPHFKHPRGAQRESCLILTARFAIAQQLLEQGFIELPQRRVSSRIVGLSGKVYEAWEYTKPERVKVSDTQFADKATAVLTLDDGRQLLVQLIGGVSDSFLPTEGLQASISIDIGDDLSIAGMSPDELRERMTLLWSGACWNSHWSDETLLGNASNLASSQAVEAFDWIVNDGTIDGFEKLTNEQKRETLLHSEVKRILEKEKRINLPEIIVTVEKEAPKHGGLSRVTQWPSEMVNLKDVRLEKRAGSIIPDVLANVDYAPHKKEEYQLLIEVTVTNTITSERIHRIQDTNLATLEIDVGRLGGIVSREELTHLVIDELVAKRWLHHPKVVQEVTRLEADIDAEIQRIIKREANRAKSLETPLDEWTRRFLDAYSEYSTNQVIYSRLTNRSASKFELDEQSARTQLSLENLQDCAHALELHGYPEAYDFFNPSHFRLLDRLFSISINSVIGYDVQSCWQVINTMFMDKERSCSWHTLYLIAINQYNPTLTKEQADKVQKWRNKVIDSIKSGSNDYLRSTKYDALLSLLFPEMRTAIARSFGKYSSDRKQTNSSNHHNSNSNTNHKYDTTRTGSFWLKGKELDEWKRKYPQAAKIWFGE